MRTLRMLVVMLALAAGIVSAGQARAELKLPSIFGDHMVLQRNRRVPIWGHADANQAITVSVGSRRVTVRSDSEGRWMARIGPFPAGGPHEITVQADQDVVALRDVMFGEVWIASGQSNMEWPLASSRNAASEVQSASNNQLRLFIVGKSPIAHPVDDCTGKWSVCSPDSAAGFSAVAYFFGRALYRRLQIPIGLIETAWGGTPAESWTPRKWLEGDPDLTPMLSRIPPPGQTTKPNDPSKPAWDSWTPTSLYNGMIAPLVPYAAAGFIWYQGESNADRAYQYRKLFPAMIRSWREAWKDPDMAFLWVQLANFMKRAQEPGDSAWAELREAQTMTLSLARTGQAVIIDIGEADDIHPRNKQDVGMRLALQAQAIVYGDKDILASSPMFDRMSANGNKVTVTFTHTGRGLTTQDGLPAAGFAIAGRDRIFHWADARVQGNAVVLTSPKVDAPIAVRYGWADNPHVNLVNSAGLPACPFRTDIWQGVTINNR